MAVPLLLVFGLSVVVAGVVLLTVFLPYYDIPMPFTLGNACVALALLYYGAALLRRIPAAARAAIGLFRSGGNPKRFIQAAARAAIDIFHYGGALVVRFIPVAACVTSVSFYPDDDLMRFVPATACAVAAILLFVFSLTLMALAVSPSYILRRWWQLLLLRRRSWW